MVEDSDYGNPVHESESDFLLFDQFPNAVSIDR